MMLPMNKLTNKRDSELDALLPFLIHVIDGVGMDSPLSLIIVNIYLLLDSLEDQMSSSIV